MRVSQTTCSDVYLECDITADHVNSISTTQLKVFVQLGQGLRLYIHHLIKEDISGLVENYQVQLMQHPKSYRRMMQHIPEVPLRVNWQTRARFWAAPLAAACQLRNSTAHRHTQRLWSVGLFGLPGAST